MKDIELADVIIRNGKEYKIYKGATINSKGVLDEEDFIDIFKDSDDKAIQYMINGIIDSFITDLRSLMGQFANNLAVLINNKEIESLEYYHELSYIVWEKGSELSAQYDSYLDQDWCSKIYWDRVEYNMEYYWNEEIKSHEFTSNLPTLEDIFSGDYLTNVLKEAKNYVRK